MRRYTIVFVDGEGREHTATREADDSTLLAFGRLARQLADEYGPHASVRRIRLADEPDQDDDGNNRCTSGERF